MVKTVATECMAEDKKLKVCIVDLFSVRSEAEFYSKFATAVVGITSSKWEERLSVAKEFLSHLRPKISFSPNEQEEVSFDIEWENIAQTPDEIIELPEKIARSKGLKLVVCVDEFQAIGEFKDSLAFQRKLRSHWQNHQCVCYCLYGSKRHMLLEMFSDASLPFYRFGDLLLLEKISNSDWGDFIAGRFKATG